MNAFAKISEQSGKFQVCLYVDDVLVFCFPSVWLSRSGKLKIQYLLHSALPSQDPLMVGEEGAQRCRVTEQGAVAEQ